LNFLQKYFIPIIIFFAVASYVFPPLHTIVDYAWIALFVIVVPAAGLFVWWHEKQEEKKN